MVDGVLGAWGEFLSVVRVVPRGRQQLLDQLLFLNLNILEGESVLLLRKWWEAGIRQVRDVLCEYRPGFLRLRALEDALEGAWLTERRLVLRGQFDCVKGAVPGSGSGG